MNRTGLIAKISIKYVLPTCIWKYFWRISRYFVFFWEFRGISRKNLNFAGPRPREISEALFIEDEAINSQLPVNEKPWLLPCSAGFWNFAQTQSRKIHKNTRNTSQFGRSLTKYMSVQHIWDLSWLTGLFFAVNLQIYWNFVTITRKCPKTTRTS